MGAHDGHRQRIMQKLDSGVLLDHEVLEILLFNAVPRRNTNDLAHRLLAEFGSIPKLFSASFEQIQKVEGIGPSIASYICCIGKFCQKFYTSTQKEAYPEKYKSSEFFAYVKEEYKNLTKEVLDVYFLDEDGNIVTRKRFGKVNFFNAEMHPEELTKLFVEHSPSGIVVVHNHPFGEAVASEMDDYATRQIQLICSTQNVLLCDHIIYAPNGVYSYYLSGQLKKITAEYSLKGMLASKSKE